MNKTHPAVGEDSTILMKLDFIRANYDLHVL